MYKHQRLGFLVVAMALATAWAIRGQFGHEQGATWAGAIGGLALVLVSGRKDWWAKLPLVALASGIGWGVGGMISYGRVVGYGRADNFPNAFYGLGMLFVIGGLFGLIGGGLVGLTLDDTPKKKVQWGNLTAQLTAGGVIAYYFLVEQIGFKMTPPRSEAWAVCLGIGLAMLWYMAREGRTNALRVALFSMFGAGFGFAFGNFLQTMGHTYGIAFNMWNVMEYSIGFFGGLGMAYGVFSSEWEISVQPPKWTRHVALIVLLLFIPTIIYRESLAPSKFMRAMEDLPHAVELAKLNAHVSLLVLVVMAAFLIYRLWNTAWNYKQGVWFLLVYLTGYTVISYLKTGLLQGELHLNHHLYLLNLLLLGLLLRKPLVAFYENRVNVVEVKKFWAIGLGIVLVLALLCAVSINLHESLPGAHDRFPM
jgi:hypothetical protein